MAEKNKSTVQSFFLNSDTVWISENFQSLFIHKYTPSGIMDKEATTTFVSIHDIEPEQETAKFVFESTDSFLEQLMLLIQDQIHGEEGKLLNDSSANYFFVAGKDGNLYSVLIRWEQAQRLWRCGAYLQSELKMPNIRVFYPA